MCLDHFFHRSRFLFNRRNELFDQFTVVNKPQLLEVEGREYFGIEVKLVVFFAPRETHIEALVDLHMVQLSRTVAEKDIFVLFVSHDYHSVLQGVQNLVVADCQELSSHIEHPNLGHCDVDAQEAEVL